VETVLCSRDASVLSPKENYFVLEKGRRLIEFDGIADRANVFVQKRPPSADVCMRKIEKSKPVG
jgi:hypothetical protein